MKKIDVAGISKKKAVKGDKHRRPAHAMVTTFCFGTYESKTG